jgi:hypothetical protein
MEERMRHFSVVFSISLALAVPALEPATAQTNGSLQSLEAPSDPQMCTAVRANGASAADRLNLIASDVAAKTKEALDSSKVENALRDCVSALSNLFPGADIRFRYPNIGSLLSKVVDRACHVADQQVTTELQTLRSQVGSPGGYFGLQGAATPLGTVNVNTQESSSYAANCVWDWLNGRSTRCH